MHRRSRIAAALALTFVVGQLSVLPLTPAFASSCLLCLSPAPTTPTPTPTPTPSTTRLTTPSATATSVTASSTPTLTPTDSSTDTPTDSPTGLPTDSPTASITATPSSINGPDVASYQHPATAAYPNGKPINWTSVANSGMSFAIVKATESNNYTNPFFADDYADSLAAGLVHGAYHFARPATPIASTAKAQAAYFAQQIGDVNTTDTLPPVLDLEVTGGLSRAQLVTWAQIFLYRLRTLTGRTPMLYTYPSFWSDVLDDPSAFSRFPLWMASYGSSAPTADLWQYTDSASVSGISGKVDESTYLGTSTHLPWATLSDGTASVPWPVAAPTAPSSVTAVAGPASATVSWVPGNDGNTRTTSYLVTSTPDGLTTKVNGAATSATVTGLDPATAYTFTVTAVSGAGSSAPSAATTAITPTVPTQLAPVQPATINYGQALSISAVLSRTDTTTPMPLPNEPVTVYRKAPKATTWKTFGTATTAADGSINVTLHPKSAVEVKLAFKGASGYQATSVTGTTAVRAVVTAVLSKTRIKHGKSVKLTGTVLPVVAGEQVTLEQQVNGKWQAGPVKTVNAQGGFTFTRKAVKKGTTQTYEVLASPGHGVATGTSPSVVLTVT